MPLESTTSPGPSTTRLSLAWWPAGAHLERAAAKRVNDKNRMLPVKHASSRGRANQSAASLQDLTEWAVVSTRSKKVGETLS